MPSQGTAQAAFLGAVGLFFAVNAIRYPVGTLTRFGPGLFPLLVSSALLLLAVAALIRSRLVPTPPLDVQGRAIGLIMLALGAFVLAAKLVNTMVAIVVLVFIAAGAGRSYSLPRNVAVAAALVGVAGAFQMLLGLRLGLL